MNSSILLYFGIAENIVGIETFDKFYAQGILQITLNVTDYFYCHSVSLLGFVPYLACGFYVLIC